MKREMRKKGKKKWRGEGKKRKGKGRQSKARQSKVRQKARLEAKRRQGKARQGKSVNALFLFPLLPLLASSCVQLLNIWSLLATSWGSQRTCVLVHTLTGLQHAG